MRHLLTVTFFLQISYKAVISQTTKQQLIKDTHIAKSTVIQMWKNSSGANTFIDTVNHNLIWIVMFLLKGNLVVAV